MLYLMTNVLEWQNKIRKRWSWVIKWSCLRAVSASHIQREQRQPLRCHQLSLLPFISCLLHCFSIYLTLKRLVKYWELSDSFQKCWDTSKTLSTLKTQTFQSWTVLCCGPLPTPLSGGSLMPCPGQAQVCLSEFIPNEKIEEQSSLPLCDKTLH